VVSPGTAGPNRFDATVDDYDSGRPTQASSFSLRLQLNDRPDVAATTVELTRDADAHWRGTSSAVSIDGRWTLTAVVQSGGDAVEVPLELVTARRSPPGG
jgi:hypothetical protein